MSTTLVAIIVAVIALQVAAQVYALVDLARRDAVRGGRKWVWALVIVLGNLPGVLAYLAAGRLTMPVDVAPAHSGSSAAGKDAARRAVEELYGPGGRR